MGGYYKRILSHGGAAVLIGAALLAAGGQSRAAERTGSLNGGHFAVGQDKPAYLTVGEATRAPIGWLEFCVEYKNECNTRASEPRDVVLTQKAWADLVKVNNWVNDTIKPITDADHWGVVEKWSYPDDGQGDCEDYVLLKRKLLMQAGWPREALLITVVRDKKGDGHAVLTVKTNRGEFVLDNQEAEVLAWNKTGYRFVKRQSQTDQNSWVSLGEPRPPVAVSSR